MRYFIQVAEITKQKPKRRQSLKNMEQKSAFLGFSDVGPDYMQANENTAGILSAKNPRFDEIIKNAAKQVDYLVVTFHFGDEYQAKHNARQEYLAHEAVDDGAKIIIGFASARRRRHRGLQE